MHRESRDARNDLSGRLLIASPHLADGNFDRTIVFVLQHDPDTGALGIILNRPSTSDLDEPLSQWSPLAAPPGVFFQGGPVGLGSAIGLGRMRAGEHEGAPLTPVTPGVAIIDLDADPHLVGTAVSEIRVFAGYAGWDRGQLEGEMELGAWFAVDAHADDVFTADPAQLWKRVLKRQRNDLVFLANYPPDPRLN